MAYSQSVEQWRGLVSKYFKPEDMDKALYVLQGESGGNPNAISDSGGYGLFQLNDGGLGEGYSTAQRLDPETNVRVAAQAVYGGSGWVPWGEGTYGQPPYDPRTGKGSFGVLGNAPYGGESSGGSGGGSVPTGNYDADIEEYWNAAEAARRQLDEYQAGHSKTVIVGEQGVFFLDPDNPNADDDGMVFDPVGTKILQEAIRNESAMDRLQARKDAGIGGSGTSAAQAYLTSEKNKAEEATRKYENYITRIKDLAALEDLPTARAMDLATALNTANANRSRGTFNQLGAGMGQSGMPMRTDMDPFAKSLKGTIPAEAPAPYDIPADALVPDYGGASGTGTYKVPTYRSPQEVLASSGIAPTIAEDRMSPREFNLQGGATGGPTFPTTNRNTGMNAAMQNAFGGKETAQAAFDRMAQTILNQRKSRETRYRR